MFASETGGVHEGAPEYSNPQARQATERPIFEGWMLTPISRRIHTSRGGGLLVMDDDARVERDRIARRPRDPRGVRVAANPRVAVEHPHVMRSGREPDDAKAARSTADDRDAHHRHGSTVPLSRRALMSAVTLPPRMTTAEPPQRRAPLVATVRDKPLLSARIITIIAIVVPPLALLSVTGLLWGVAVGPVDLITFAVMYLFCGLGITIGFHRLFSHRGFKTTRPVTATLAILGSMTLQGPLTQWVTDHRKHHALSDREGDPHSPHFGYGGGFRGVVRGLWHAQVGWLLTTKGLERGERYGKDLYADPMIRWIDRLYMAWLVLSLGIPFLVGYLAGGFSVALGLQCFVWAGLLRVFVFDHATWSVNSICHMYGRRDFETMDESRNFWPLALPVFGEAWHNNHHAFPGSARHGLRTHQVDVSWMIIRGMEKVGMVWDVKVPVAARQEIRRNA